MIHILNYFVMVDFDNLLNFFKLQNVWFLIYFDCNTIQYFHAEP